MRDSASALDTLGTGYHQWHLAPISPLSLEEDDTPFVPSGTHSKTKQTLTRYPRNKNTQRHTYIQMMFSLGDYCCCNT